MKDHTRDFAAIYDAHVREIYDFLYYKTFDQAVTEDLTSITFMKALEHLAEFRKKPGSSVKSWLYKIARNTVIDYYRTKKLSVDIEAINEPTDRVSLPRDLENKMKLEMVMEKLKALPQSDQEIIILRLWQELSYNEISLVLDKNPLSAKMAYSRAIRKLRAAINNL